MTMENILVSLFKGYADTCPIEVPLKTIISLLRDNQAVIEHTEKHRYYPSKTSHRRCTRKSILPLLCRQRALRRRKTESKHQRVDRNLSGRHRPRAARTHGTVFGTAQSRQAHLAAICHHQRTWYPVTLPIHRTHRQLREKPPAPHPHFYRH